jgi:ribonucleotide monophosphatase NagD (HAD superfamily)
MAQAQPKFKHILELTRAEKETFLNSFDSVISDCDGVLWHLTKPLPDIGPAINLLKGAGKKFSYITNNSVRPMWSYMDLFNDVLKTETKPEDILHPARNIVNYLRKVKFEGLIYCIASTVFKTELKEAGFELIDGVSMYM